MTVLIALLSFGDFWWSLANLVYIASLWAKVCDIAWCQIVRILTQFSAFSTVVSTCCMATLGLLSLYYPDAAQQRATSLAFVAVIFLLPTAQNAFLALWPVPFMVLESGWCLPQKVFHDFAWFLPIGICLAYIIIAFTLLVVNYYCFFSREKTEATGGPSAFRFLIKKVSARILVFLFVWGIDLGAFLLNPGMMDDHSSFMWYLVEISVNSSGLLHFLIYGLDNKDFRRHYSLMHGLLIFAIAPAYLIGVTAHYIYRRLLSDCTARPDHSDAIDRDVSSSTSFVTAMHSQQESGSSTSATRPFLSMKHIRPSRVSRETTSGREGILIPYDATNTNVEATMSTSIND
jgi:hypothetical protein